MKKIHHYASLSTILLMFFIDFVGLGLVYPMFSSMLFNTSSHLLPPETSLATRGLLLGIFLAMMPLAQFFSGPILGTLSDRKGRKPLMLISIAFGALGDCFAFAGVWYENILLLALSRIIIGISAGNEAVGCAAVADLSTPEEKTKNFGLLHMAAGIGFTVGPFLGGKLSTMDFGLFSGYTVPFVCAGILSVINFISVIFLFKETHKATQATGIIDFGLINLKKAWRMPGFFLLFVAIFFYNFGWSFYWEFIAVYWIEVYQFTAAMVGNGYAWGAAFYALSSGLLIRPFINRFKPQMIIFYGLIAGALSLTIPLIFQATWLHWLYIPIQQYFIALIFPVTTALISNKSSDAAQGEMMGIQQSVQSLALILAPLTAGLFLGISVKMPLIIGACSFLLAACILRKK